METIVKKLYEAMFLIDSAEAAADWDGITTTIKNILERAGAEIVSMKKWEERNLAYEIKGKARGTYILCYFKAGGERIRDIERDVRLSERIMRVLILCAEHRETEHRKKEDIEKGTAVVPAEKREQKATQTAAESVEAEQVNAPLPSGEGRKGVEEAGDV